MAYSFPPRGFFTPPTSLSNNQHFPPNFGSSPFPPPWQPPQAPPRPPWGNSSGPVRPPFPPGRPHFAPQIPGRLAGASEWSLQRGPAPRAVEPGAVRDLREEFPLQRLAGHDPRRVDNSVDRNVDVTEFESWPGNVGRQHDFRSDGQHTQSRSKINKGPLMCTSAKMIKDGHSAWKNQQGKPSKKTRRRRGGKGSNTAKQTSNQLEHHCDVCDRGFKSKELLDGHLAEHVKCDHVGCKFEAHFKVVRVHAKLQHSAESKKVAWMDSPAEVAKWRAERKRNYPSVDNIAKKAEAMQRNEDKGVVLQNKYFGKMRQPKRGQQRHRNFQGNNDAKKARMDAITVGKDKSSKDVDCEAGTCPTTHHQGVVVSSGHLGSLSALTAYGDSSEEEEGEIKDDTFQPEVVAPPQKPSARIRSNNGRCGPGWRHFKGKKTKRHAKTDRSGYLRAEHDLQLRLKKRPNLLEMLLAPEIRKERNIILQCVQHVVQNDFFGVNGTKLTKQESERSPPLVLEESVKDESRLKPGEMNGIALSLDRENARVNDSMEKKVESIADQASHETQISDTVRNDRVHVEVNAPCSSLHELDGETGEAFVANERANTCSVLQNGFLCDKVRTDCNANARVNGVQGVGTSIGEESGLRNAENSSKLDLPSANG